MVNFCFHSHFPAESQFRAQVLTSTAAPSTGSDSDEVSLGFFFFPIFVLPCLDGARFCFVFIACSRDSPAVTRCYRCCYRRRCRCLYRGSSWSAGTTIVGSVDLRPISTFSADMPLAVLKFVSQTACAGERREVSCSCTAHRVPPRAQDTGKGLGQAAGNQGEPRKKKEGFARLCLLACAMHPRLEVMKSSERLGNILPSHSQ